MDKASHTTDLSVSGEEDRSAISLALYIFLVLIEDKVISNAYRLLTIYIFQHQTKNKMFFRATFKQLSLPKATFDCSLRDFFRNYRKLFGKSRVICGKALS